MSIKHTNVSTKKAVLATVACLGLSCLMVSDKLVEIAERQPLGEDRDRWLTAAQANDRVANFLSLNRPYDLLRSIRGAGTDAGEQVDTIDAVAAELGLTPSNNQQANQDINSKNPNPQDTTPNNSSDALDATPGNSSNQNASSSNDSGIGHVSGSNESNRGDGSDSDASESDGSNTAKGATSNASGSNGSNTGKNVNTGNGSNSEGSHIGNGSDTDKDASSKEKGWSGGSASGHIAERSEAVTRNESPDHPPPPRDKNPADKNAKTESSGIPDVSTTTPNPKTDDDANTNDNHSPLRSDGQRRPVSADAPLVTYVAGDSQAHYVGYELRTGWLKKMLEVEIESRHSTSLARPDYFNWPAHLVEVRNSQKPELVVLFLGSNDWQAMSAGNTHFSLGTPEWERQWSWRLAVTLEILAAPYRHVVWVGLPPTRDDDLRVGYAVMNRLAAEVIATRNDTTMIDIWELFGGDGPYQSSISPPSDSSSKPVKVRQSDGIHLNVRGARWVADLVRQIVAEHWDLTPQ